MKSKELKNGISSETNYMQISLEFQGYTWDEYFYVIANKPGIVVVYKGGLDSEGAIRLDNIIYVDGADEIGQVYEGKMFKDKTIDIEINKHINLKILSELFDLYPCLLYSK